MTYRGSAAAHRRVLRYQNPAARLSSRRMSCAAAVMGAGQSCGISCRAASIALVASPAQSYSEQKQVTMTERHYAHLVPSHVAQVIRATMPKLGLVEPSPAVSPTTMLQRVRSQQARASACDANPSGYEMLVGTQRGGRPV
jgi:hypothetical protein